MALLAAVLLGGVLLGGAACTSSGAGDCADRSPPELRVGTGVTAFHAVDAEGVAVVKGVQGGYHVWIALHAGGLGPRITAKLGVRDTMTGESLTFDDLEQVVDLAPEGQGEAEIAGLRGFLKADVVPTLAGREVTLWASASDACDASAADEVATFVADIPPSGGWPGAGGSAPADGGAPP